MKKISLLLIALLALALLAACGAAEEEEPQTGMPNPMTETDAGELAAQGLFLPAPENAEDVAYFRYDVEGADPIGELRFTLDGKEAALRAQRTELEDLSVSDEQVENIAQGELDFLTEMPGDISGLYCDWQMAGTTIVRDRPALWRVGDGAGFVAWVDAGTLYNLIMTEDADQETMTALAEQVFVSVTDK